MTLGIMKGKEPNKRAGVINAIRAKTVRGSTWTTATDAGCNLARI
jgi:hypothetical protein